MNKNIILGVLALFLLAGCSWFTNDPIENPVVINTQDTSCDRFICGNDTYTGSGDLSGWTWAAIQERFAKNYFNNTHGWNQTQTWSNGSVTYLWMPWYSGGLAESDLKDTYTQSAYGLNANWTVNTAVTDEASEMAIASILNWTNTTVLQFINYLDVCADTNVDHSAEGYWLTSWVCSQRDGVITKNDENSASDATARFAIALFMACHDQDLDSTTRSIACARAVNISSAAVREEVVWSCRNSTVNTSTTLCSWRLAGAAQAWGGGALTQSGQQMFAGYHASDVMAHLAAYAYTGDPKYSSAARNETHQFLFYVGFRNQGNSSSDFNYTTGGAHYFLDCTTNPCVVDTTSGSTQMDDSDATRVWEMCPVVEYANLTYTTRGESIPWEFVALERYCDSWTARIGPQGAVVASGSVFANLTSACYRIADNATCSSLGIVGLNSFKPAGWVSFVVGRTLNVSYWNTFVAGTLSTYDTTNDVFGSEDSFGIYGEVRYLHSIRSHTGFYDFLFTNTTFNHTRYFGGESFGESPDVFNFTSQSINTTTGAIGDHVFFNVTVNVTPGTVSSVLAEVATPTGVRLNYTMTNVVPGVALPAIAVMYNETFTTGCSWTGGNCDNTSHGVYNATASSTITSPDLNLSNYTWYRLTWWQYSTLNQTNEKHYINELTSTTGNTHLLTEKQAGGVSRTREEPGYSASCSGIAYLQWKRLFLDVTRLNLTHATVIFNTTSPSGNCQWTKTFAINWTQGAERDYMRIETGQFLTGGYVYYDNITLEVNCTESLVGCGGGDTTVPYYYFNFTNTTSNGYYNWTNVWATSSGGDVNTTTESYRFLIGTDTAPKILLTSPANASTWSNRSLIFTFTATDDAALSMSCSLMTNYTGAWAQLNSTTATNGTSTELRGLLNASSIVWNVNCTDDIGGSAMNLTNYTLTINNTRGNLTSISYCAGVTRLTMAANASLINSTTNLTTQSTRPAGNTSCTLYFDASLETSRVSWKYLLNASNATMKVVVNGTNLTTSWQVLTVVEPGSIAYVNITGHWYNSTRVFYPFRLNITNE